jgi:hypothetical protein
VHRDVPGVDQLAAELCDEMVYTEKSDGEQPFDGGVDVFDAVGADGDVLAWQKGLELLWNAGGERWLRDTLAGK